MLDVRQMREPEGAKPKSCRDDIIPAQGKRSVALGQGPKMNTSLFSKLRWPGQHNFEKREIGGGGGLPRAAASAALPWADMLLPFQGAAKQTEGDKCYNWRKR